MRREEVDLVLLIQLFLQFLNTLAEGVLGTLQLGNHGFSLFELSAQLTFTAKANRRAPVILLISLNWLRSVEEPYRSRSGLEPFECCCR